MSKNDKSQNEDFSFEEEIASPESGDELESQLTADAAFLHQTFPSTIGSSDRRNSLIASCLQAASQIDAEATTAKTVDRSRAASSKRQSDSRAWLKTMVAGTITVASLFAISFWASSVETDGNQTPIVTGPTPGGAVPELQANPVSRNPIPRRMRMASQPELEAMYDMMPNKKVAPADF